MKKLLFILAFLSSFIGFSFAYTPTTGDLETINQLKTTLDEINSWNVQDMRNFSTQIKELFPIVTQDERITYILKELYNHLYDQFIIEKIKTKQESKSGFNQFLQEYNTGIIDIDMEDNCTWWYNTMDNISFANNFPTALTIATRYRETHCKYYLPSNGDGPFQILSKDYGTGEITEKIFTQSIQDFIDFSKSKYQQYKTKLGINLSYTGINLTGIIYHSALYNGGTISWSTESGYEILPNNPKYVYEWYTNYNSWEFSTNTIRHGVLPKFIKTLEYELNNYY